MEGGMVHLLPLPSYSNLHTSTSSPRGCMLRERKVEVVVGVEEEGGQGRAGMVLV